MRLRILVALSGALFVLPAMAANNAVLLTPCSSSCVTMRTQDIGGGVQSPLTILGDTAGTPLATAPGSGNTSFALPIQGVASGVAIPISAASLPLPTGSASSANQTNGSQKTQIVDGSGNVIASTSNALNVNVSNTNANGPATMANSSPVTLASNQSVGDPCTFQAKTSVAISTASGTTALVTGVSAKKIYVCSLSLIAPSAISVSLSEGSSSTCGTSNQAAVIGVATNGTAANGLPLAANGGITLGSGVGTVAATGTTANYLCLFQSGTVQLAGNLTYVQQ